MNTIDLHTWRPKLSGNLNFFTTDDSIVINQQELGYQIRVNHETFALLRKMNGELTINELIAITNNGDKDDIKDPSLFMNFVVNEFVSKGIILSDLKINKREIAKYLKLKITLLKGSLLNQIGSNKIKILFNPLFFFPLFISTSFINLYIMLNRGFSSTNLNVSSFILFFSLLASHFIHELGHALSARSKGVSCGNIGLGFYYIIPVFFINLSDSWNVSRKARIIINLSGIYFEYIISLLSYAVYLSTSEPFFLALSVLIFIKSWYNLNPFLRSDFYWVLSDFFNKPNLNENASNELSNVIKYFLKSKQRKPNWFLSVYGLCIILFWIYIIISFYHKGASLLKSLPLAFNDLKYLIVQNTLNLRIVSAIAYKYLFLLFCIIFVSFFIKSCISKLKRIKLKNN